MDAAIGGKTAIDLPEGKNLVGAFHWPARTLIDPALLATLPERERKNGMAEVVKTGLLAGESLWELPDGELVRRCAAFKAAVCLRDPHDHGARKMLNLGHTFAHALEAGARYGSRTAKRSRSASWRRSACRASRRTRSKRCSGHSPCTSIATSPGMRSSATRRADAFVLLDAPGEPRIDVELSPEQVRAELDRLIAD